MKDSETVNKVERLVIEGEIKNCETKWKFYGSSEIQSIHQPMYSVFKTLLKTRPLYVNP